MRHQKSGRKLNRTAATVRRCSNMAVTGLNMSDSQHLPGGKELRRAAEP